MMMIITIMEETVPMILVTMKRTHVREEVSVDLLKTAQR